MRVLVAHGSLMGGTEGIARMLASTLGADGLATDVRPAGRVTDVVRYDAAVIGGAVYSGQWHQDARQLLVRHLEVFRCLPVWLFSSGPLDASASAGDIAPPPEVAAIAARIGARGHTTFGGRLPSDVDAFLARTLGREHAGDWRDPERIDAWAQEIAAELRGARSLSG